MISCFFTSHDFHGFSLNGGAVFQHESFETFPKSTLKVRNIESPKKQERIRATPGIDKIVSGLKIEKSSRVPDRIFKISALDPKEIVGANKLTLIVSAPHDVEQVVMNGNFPLGRMIDATGINIPLNRYPESFTIDGNLHLSILTKDGKNYEITLPWRKPDEPLERKGEVSGYPLFHGPEELNEQTKRQLEFAGKAIKEFEIDSSTEVFDGVVLEESGQPSWGKYFMVGKNYLDGTLFQQAVAAGEIKKEDLPKEMVATEYLVRWWVRHEGYHKLWCSALPGMNGDIGHLRSVSDEQSDLRANPHVEEFRKLIDLNRTINEEGIKRRGGQYTDRWDRDPDDFVTFIKDSVFYKKYDRMEGHPDKLDDKLVSCSLTLENLEYLEQRLNDVRKKDEGLFQDICKTYLEYINVVLGYLEKAGLTGQAKFVQNQRSAIEYLKNLWVQGKLRIEKIAQT